MILHSGVTQVNTAFRAAGKLSLIRNAAALNTNHTMEMLDDLHQLNIPLLLLWGEKDQFQPLATAKRFHQEFPQTELQVIPDSDHFLPLEKGPEVAQILLNYLRGVQPPKSSPDG